MVTQPDGHVYKAAPEPTWLSCRMQFFEFPEETMNLVQGKEHTPLGLCYLFIGIVGCLGHLRLFTVFRRHAGFHGNNRNTYLLHLGLAVANLGVVGGFPFPGLSYIAGKWLFGGVGCQLYAFEGMAFGLASIFMLLLMSLERYLALYKSDLLKAATRKHYVLSIGAGWLMAVYWAALPFWGFGRYTLEPTGTSCAINWHRPDAYYPTYILLVTGWCFVVPFAVIFTCLGLVTFADAGRNVDDYRSDALLTSDELKKLPSRLTLLSLTAWTPYACVCLQFLIRDPGLTSVLTASLPPIFAKMVTALIPFVYGLSSDGMFDALTVNKPLQKID